MNCSLQKLVALILISALTAGFTQPLVWCISGPDHNKVEFKIGGTGHEISTRRQAPPRTFEYLSTQDDRKSENCVDLRVLPETMARVSIDLAGILAVTPIGSPWAGVPPARAPTILAHSVAFPELQSLSVVRTQLDHIRTIVLLT